MSLDLAERPIVFPEERPEAGKPFDLASDYQPAGDQPTAIEELIRGLKEGERDQVRPPRSSSGSSGRA
jgi:excinuclease ABC subunit B